MNIAKSSLKLFAVRTGKAVISFIAVIVFSRKLGADPLGIYYPFVALLGVALLPSDLGIGSAVTKRLSEGKDRRQYVGAALLMKMPIVVVVGIGALLASEQINRFLGADLAVIFVIVLLVNGLGGISIRILHGELRVDEAAVLEIFRPLGWLILGYILFTFGYGAEGLVYGYFFGSILVGLIGWWRVSVLPARPNLDHVYSLFDFAKFSAISSVGGFFYSWMDILILTSFVSVGIGVTRGDIGAYENAWRLSLVVMLLGKSVATVLFPQISEWDTKNNIKKIESSISTALLPSLLVVIPGFVGTLILSRDLLRILFGQEFTVAWIALIILTAGKIPQSLHILLSKALNAVDRPDLAAIAAILSAVLNAILNIIFIWRFGLVGAAIATTVSFLINTILHWYYLAEFLEVRLPIRNTGFIIVASVIMGVCIHYITIIVEPNRFFSLVGIVLCGIIVYSSILIVFKPIRVEVQEKVQQIIPDIVS
jgi:O-antigen/teichoic acid export membrane protein